MDVLDHAFRIHLREVVERVADDDCSIYQSQVCLIGVAEVGVGAVWLCAKGNTVETGRAVDFADSSSECEDVDGFIECDVPE